MSVHLIFLFLFQGGLAFAFTYFIARVLHGGAGQDNARMAAGMRKIRLVVLASAVVLPMAMFAAYYKSLPEDTSTSLALWPAAWILVILLAVVAALSMALQRTDKPDPGK